MMENEHGDVAIMNISTLSVQSKEDALKLLLLGEMNRRISETTNNKLSEFLNVFHRDAEK